MAFSTFWDTITNRTGKPKQWSGANDGFWRGLASPTHTPPATPTFDLTTMADSDAPKTSEQTDAPGEIRNLPVPVPPAGEPRDASERWFARMLRAVFGWKTGSIRSDLKVVLEARS